MNKSRDKGNRFERQVVNLLQGHGIEAKRIPLSGQTWLKGDLIIGGEIAELKVRKNGFKRLYQWLQDARYLILKSDREEALLVMRLQDWIGEAE